MAPANDPKTPTVPPTPSRKEVFDATLSGVRDPPLLPKISSDPSILKPIARTLPEYTAIEGAENREARLRALWRQLPSVSGEEQSSKPLAQLVKEHADLTPERANKLRDLYLHELFGHCDPEAQRQSGDKLKRVSWKAFLHYADAKEKELWQVFHNDLDLDGNGHLDAAEWSAALRKAGINLGPNTLTEFMAFLTSSPHSHAVSFPEFRDFLLLLPRKASPTEIYRYYQLRKYLGDDGRGPARVNMEGDVSLSAEDRPPTEAKHKPIPPLPTLQPPSNVPPLDGREPSSSIILPRPEPPRPETLIDHEVEYSPFHGDEDEDEREYDEDEEVESHIFGGSTSLKFLLAGGVAGVVSRTATAPFDRLKVYLITRPPDLTPGDASAINNASATTRKGASALANAIKNIYAEGGVRAFWVGNALSVTKIFPESAIKFMSYETSKRMFAKYWDKVEDSRDISGVSRFMSGGIGGMASQLSIYPIETMKTQMMSTTGKQTRALLPTMKRLWALGGVRAYYRGLVIGLIGVFPYSAIDMSTFEALKLAYIRSTGQPEPGVLALLAFGSISGSVGATSVYPINLVRTRLQASGSSGHPQRYTGIMDVAFKTYERDGWKGFYKGLAPTLAKVVPAVSISYVVYESTKRKLGV